MSGAVFHPGHDELHGITVVIFTKGPRTFVGRWDEVQGDLIRIVGASFHEEGEGEKDSAQWVADTKKFGVAVQHETLMVPKADVTKVVPLREA